MLTFQELYTLGGLIECLNVTALGDFGVCSSGFRSLWGGLSLPSEAERGQSQQPIVALRWTKSSTWHDSWSRRSDDSQLFWEVVLLETPRFSKPHEAKLTPSLKASQVGKTRQPQAGAQAGGFVKHQQSNRLASRHGAGR